MITLTTEQAQQIEEALEDIVRVFKFETGTPVEALAVIRAARAQERETVVCESCGETIPECQIAGETESGGVACVGCVVAYFEDRATALEKKAEQKPVAQQDSDDRRLLREIFMLCEATEELESTNDFMRGRIFEAKCIRRGIGTWYQDTFCGRSYMGEPVLNAAPVRTKDLTDDEILEINQYTTLQFARAVIAADKGNSK
jgi:hypothetical protein